MYNKDWHKNNKEHCKLKKVRCDLKNRMVKFKMIPQSYPYSKEHEEYMDLLMSNQFVVLRPILEGYKSQYLKEKAIIKSKEIKVKRIKTQEEKDEIKKLKSTLSATKKLIKSGLLPEDMSNLTDKQKEVYHMLTVLNMTTYEIIKDNINDANVITKQKHIFDRLRLKMKHPHYVKKGTAFNVKAEDIMINEYCPFLGTKIDYKSYNDKKFRNDTQSTDRFNNHMGYVKGNVWVISRLANTIKNDSTIEELKTFCKNVIKLHGNKTNRGI